MSPRRIRLNEGEKIVTLYFAVYYFFPLIGNLLFADKITSSYKIFELTWLSAMALVGTYIGFLFLSCSKLLSRVHLRFSSITRLFSKIAERYLRYRWYLAYVFLVIAGLYFWQGLSGYRYSRVSISERDSSVLIVSLLISNVIMIDLFYRAFIERSKPALLWSKLWFTDMIVAASLILFADGTAAMFLALQLALLVGFPGIIQNLWFVPFGETRFEVVKRTSKLVVLCTLIFVFSWAYGEAIKNRAGKVITAPPVSKEMTVEGPPQVTRLLWGLVDVDFTAARANQARIFARIEYVTERIKRAVLDGDFSMPKSGGAFVPSPPPPDEGTGVAESLSEKFARKIRELIAGGLPFFSDRFAYYLVERLSVHYYSFLYTFQADRSELKYDGIQPLFLPLRTFFFRVDYLFGRMLGVQRPELTSVSQLNYRLLAKSPTNLREGSSPGPIGSANYAFPVPISLVICALYLVALAKMFSTLLQGKNSQTKVSSLGLLLATSLLAVFFEAPADIFLIIDNGIFRAVLLFGVFLCIRNPQAREIAV